MGIYSLDSQLQSESTGDAKVSSEIALIANPGVDPIEDALDTYSDSLQLKPLELDQLEYIHAQSPFRRARLTSTDRVKENIQLVHNLMAEWDDHARSTARSMAGILNKTSNSYSERTRSSEDEDEYWNAKSKRIWQTITAAINEERLKIVEEQRKKDEERRRREEEQLRLEKLRAEKEKQELERARLEREKREQKEREQHEKEIREQEKKERDQREREEKKLAEQRDELVRQEQRERAKENKAREEEEWEDIHRHSTAGQSTNQVNEARQKVIDAVQKRMEREQKGSTAGTQISLKDLSISNADKANVNVKDTPASKQSYVAEAVAEKDYYDKLIAAIKRDILTPVAANKELKKYCSEGKRKIKPKLGQLTNSQSQILKIIRELDGILNEAKNSDICYRWLLNFLSKAIVSQAETETGVSTISAFPLGTVGLYMMSRHPLLRDFLIARFVKKCPYVIGFNCPINTEEGRIKMGYKRDVDDKWEDDGQYTERMGGMTAVWTVLTWLEFAKATGALHPYPMYHSWTFISRTLNIPTSQLTNAHFAVVASWWEIASSRFLEAYGRQGRKILMLAWDEFTESVRDKRFPAAARLRILGELWRKTGKTGIERPREA